MNQILTGDCIKIMEELPSGVAQCCITSPPYWGLRDYGEPGQHGLEKTLEEYVARMVDVFRAVRQVLRDDGTVFLNLGDSYVANYRWGGLNGVSKKQLSNVGTTPSQKPSNQKHPIKPKNMCMIPARVALALQADGWWLRSDVIWAKPNPMPESVIDRPTKSYEHIFLLSKKAKYYYDADAVREPYSDSYLNDNRHNTGSTDKNMKDGYDDALAQNPKKLHKMFDKPVGNGRNLRDVWFISTQPCRFAHFATFPEELVNRCILMGTKEGDVVLDPFGGTGTVAYRAQQMGRQFIHIDISEKYNAYARERTRQAVIV